ncbi:PEP-CTERM protein sorting domain protein [Fuerstiella marisgermanici]|uniref:PEP-CTERM protein sorting domain protein n=2 Tax=Fuerstiella marisgermanici TaxID=1891926 RepID=A0A1P8WNX2_9PLAN|nr:PEP-CTERM protein sorting domain protein [Fuerstiella marisgermanici]
MSKITIALLSFLLPAASLQADVITMGSHAIAFTPSLTPIGSGTFTNGAAAPDVSESYTLGSNTATFSFNLTDDGAVAPGAANFLELAVDLGGFLTTGENITWELSSLIFASGADIFSVTQLTGAAAVSITHNSDDMITIQTPTATANQSYTFLITDDLTAATVPEPSSFALLILGGAGFWGVRRRRRQG